MNCDCCTGTQSLTPQATAQRPGLAALAVRIGTQAAFLETMKARLSSTDFPALKGLAARDPSDPAIALLDGWATIADVLTFYQERLANEGYLRTATERRSVLELARLIGYEPRPGAAAGVHLAFTVDADRSVTPPKSITALVPAGTRVQSIPGPGESAQTFETIEKIEARTEWNNLQARLTRPSTAAELAATLTPRLFLKGTSTNLKPNDPVLLVLPGARPLPLRVTDVLPDVAAGRTEVRLRPWRTPEQLIEAAGATAKYFLALAPDAAPGAPSDQVVGVLQEVEKAAGVGKLSEVLSAVDKAISSIAGSLKLPVDDERKAWHAKILAPMEEVRDALAPFDPKSGTKAAATLTTLERDSDSFLATLKKPPSRPPANARQLPPNKAGLFAAGADLVPRLLAATSPELTGSLFPALSELQVTEPEVIRFYALRATIPVFGHNAQPRPLTFSEGIITTTGEWPLIERKKRDLFRHESDTSLNLEGNLDKVAPGSLLLVETAPTRLTPPRLQTLRARSVQPALSRADYGISGTITKIRLQSFPSDESASWIDIDHAEKVGSDDIDSDIEALRQTVVFGVSEELPLAEVPIDDSIGACAASDGPTEIELDGLYDGLDPGRWLIIVGERDIPGTSGVAGAELAMLAGVSHRVADDLPGDKLHTYLTLSTSLAYCYRRATLVIYGNVAKATHGETRREVLGSGDASAALLKFDLKQPPLTFISAAVPSGIRSTLRVRVNDVEWHEADSLEGLGPLDCRFVVQINDDGRTVVIFGNGRSGTRPPTGNANLQAEYRRGLGVAGNVRPGQIALLSSRPLGVREVINPLRASGGADRESRDDIRRNAPLAVQALDRLVSVQDYADFARTFAGIGKASARRVNDGGRQLVHLTIAGADDIPIDEHSDLFLNLQNALRDYGDAALPVKIATRELLMLSITARVRVQADYEWDTVEPALRSALLDAFSFSRRDLGQGIAKSEVISVMQRVRGIEYVDLDSLAGIDPASIEGKLAATLTVAKASVVVVTSTTKLKPSPGVVVRLARANPDPVATPRILPAQLAILPPGVPEMLQLSEITA